MNKRVIDDNQLVFLYINGDESALAELLMRHKRRIYSSIYLVVRNKEITEDIFQDTFFKVINSLKAGQYYEDGKFLPWVLRIARNLVIDHFRRIKKMPTIPNIVNDEGEEVDIFSILNIQENNDHQIEKSQFKKTMRNLVEELPSEQKEVLIMRMYYDMSFKEIADFTQVSINTSLGRMRYALINLKKMLEDKNVEIPV
ncbi:MAG: polymerase subunit sigma-24 [Bacteroidetes bacterium]|jgi:RNA polymerase sigma-70 factor (ECF subfamily)|nr:polymerase subunit sigma-24 [Bacteroidota bacterium]